MEYRFLRMYLLRVVAQDAVMACASASELRCSALNIKEKSDKCNNRENFFFQSVITLSVAQICLPVINLGLS